MFQEQNINEKQSFESQLTKFILSSQNISTFFSWSLKYQKWVPQQFNPKFINFSNQNQIKNFIEQKTNKLNKQLISVTFNVLFDFRASEQPDQDRGHMKYSTQRYQSILNQLQKMHCDVITLNQVTRPFVRMIEQKNWVRKQYKISTLHDSKTYIKCFGNIILTKLNPFALHVFKVPHLPRSIPIAFFLFQLSKNYKQKSKSKSYSITSFSSIHLTAYDKNYQRRNQQLSSITKYLNSLNSYVDQHILQGDMNFHSQNQNIVAKNNKLVDAWLQVYKIKDQKDLLKYPGYTFDSTENYFIKELYRGFQKRRMRLDRIFILNNDSNNLLIPSEIKVIFNDPIYKQNAQIYSSNIFKSVIQFIGDKRKYNMFRNKQKYLFCSDHFGLICKFSFPS